MKREAGAIPLSYAYTSSGNQNRILKGTEEHRFFSGPRGIREKNLQKIDSVNQWHKMKIGVQLFHMHLRIIDCY